MLLMDFFRDALRTYLFLIPLVVMLLTEIAKVTVEWWQTGNWHAKLFHPGGMPSSHSAFVMSLLILGGFAFVAALLHAEGIAPLGLLSGLLIVGMLWESPAAAMESDS